MIFKIPLPRHTGDLNLGFWFCFVFCFFGFFFCGHWADKLLASNNKDGLISDAYQKIFCGFIISSNFTSLDSYSPGKSISIKYTRMNFKLHKNLLFAINLVHLNLQGQDRIPSIFGEFNSCFFVKKHARTHTHTTKLCLLLNQKHCKDHEMLP